MVFRVWTGCFQRGRHVVGPHFGPCSPNRPQALIGAGVTSGQGACRTEACASRHESLPLASSNGPSCLASSAWRQTSTHTVVCFLSQHKALVCVPPDLTCVAEVHFHFRLRRDFFFKGPPPRAAITCIRSISVTVCCDPPRGPRPLQRGLNRSTDNPASSCVAPAAVHVLRF